MTETTSILRNKTIGLRSFTVLSRKNNTFYYNKRKYQLLDKNFEVVESGETVFAIKDGYFIKKDNDTHIYIMKEISDARDSVFVEFPVKAYVRRE